jgi:four helix bundle protein
MSSIKRFEEIEAWQKARELTKLVYQLTTQGEWARDYGLRDQIRRATVSAMSNIAEGFERRSSADFARFLVMAKGSAGEVRSQLYVALDLEYLGRPAFLSAFKLAETTSRMIAGLTSYLKGKKAIAE